jgi:hypothetical protein
MQQVFISQWFLSNWWGAEVSAGSGNETDYTLFLSGRVNYSYDNKYIFKQVFVAMVHLVLEKQ